MKKEFFDSQIEQGLIVSQTQLLAGRIHGLLERVGSINLRRSQRKKEGDQLVGFSRKSDDSNIYVEMQVDISPKAKLHGTSSEDFEFVPKEFQYPVYLFFVQDFRTMQTTTSRYGRLPEIVVDETDRLFSIHNSYLLNQHGQSHKLEKIYLESHSGETLVQSVRRVGLNVDKDVVSKTMQSFSDLSPRTVALDIHDLEVIGGWLDEIESGKFTYKKG